jgi:hypothetical protein
MEALYPYHRAIYYEAKALAVTSEEKKQLEWFRKRAARMGTAKETYSISDAEAEALREKFMEEHLQ